MINFTNPMHRLCYLVNQYSRINGLCHQLAAGYAMGQSVGLIYGFNGADAFCQHARGPKQSLSHGKLGRPGMERFKKTVAV